MVLGMKILFQVSCQNLFMFGSMKILASRLQPNTAGGPVKVAEHSFQVPMPNSPLLLNYLCFGADFLHESRLITDVFILAFL